MFANMAASLIEHEQIVTTVPKAKEMAPIMDKLVTLAKKGDLAARRQALSKVRNEDAVRKLFDVFGDRYKDRNARICISYILITQSFIGILKQN